MTDLSRVAVLAVALALVACARPDTPQVQGPLVIDIPELCTVCVEVVRCEGPQRRAAYVLDEKDAMAQIATIWDYFAQFFRPKTEDFRDLSIYELAEDLRTPLSVRGGLRARLDVWNRRIEFPDALVDQKTGRWLATDGSQIGECVALERGPDREFKRALETAIGAGRAD